jgi:hypothetical protein
MLRCLERNLDLPDKTKCSHADGLKICVSISGQSQALHCRRRRAYRLVISNVVPKIWARTNSAMLDENAQ